MRSPKAVPRAFSMTVPKFTVTCPAAVIAGAAALPA
jgi:hypothetical protein